jgi:mannose-6-phosphate isomerase
MTELGELEQSARPGPCRLRPDNFTPPTRTPWGGRRIVENYKRGLELDFLLPARVGESWEVSVEPSFRSRLLTGEYLDKVIHAQPEYWLGQRVSARFDRQLPVLVKLVDAGQHLSVQVHPTWDDPGLGPDESGKLECWIILDADPGSVLYLGFREGVTAKAIRDCVMRTGPLDHLMNSVPVTRGDVYVIRPGTAHALGAGITLVEPQLLSVGKKATTYRLWDWNRLYDQLGQVSSNGHPRAMHLERSLQVMAWDGPQGSDFVASCRATSRPSREADVERACLVDEQGLIVEHWRGTGSFEVPSLRSICSVTCLAGATRVETEAGSLNLRSGESGVIPAGAGALAVEQMESYAIAVHMEI